jgi:hypothetical protein
MWNVEPAGRTYLPAATPAVRLGVVCYNGRLVLVDASQYVENDSERKLLHNPASRSLLKHILNQYEMINYLEDCVEVPYR